MENSVTLINLILLAVAIGVLFKLYSVLGRRTGHEREPFDPYSRPNSQSNTQPGDDKVITLPRRPQTGREGASDRAPSWGGIAPEGSELSHSLTELALADRGFDPNIFIEGARTAYEMIVTAFAKGDRSELKPLLSADVFANFDQAIKAREEKSLTVDQSLIGIDKSEIRKVVLNGTNARITVHFESQITSCTKNPDGVVVEGDPVTVRKVTDVWTFERDVKSRDPNWRLVSTSSTD